MGELVNYKIMEGRKIFTSKPDYFDFANSEEDFQDFSHLLCLLFVMRCIWDAVFVQGLKVDVDM